VSTSTSAPGGARPTPWAIPIPRSASTRHHCANHARARAAPRPPPCGERGSSPGGRDSFPSSRALRFVVVTLWTPHLPPTRCRDLAKSGQVGTSVARRASTGTRALRRQRSYVQACSRRSTPVPRRVSACPSATSSATTGTRSIRGPGQPGRGPCAGGAGAPGAGDLNSNEGTNAESHLPDCRCDYIGYFENRYGEPWIFTCHRATREASSAAAPPAGPARTRRVTDRSTG
jgi:hypothetical protein